MKLRNFNDFALGKWVQVLAGFCAGFKVGLPSSITQLGYEDERIPIFGRIEGLIFESAVKAA